MIQIEDILNILKEKNPEAIPDVVRAYDIANDAHNGVMRESGEPYITHPLTVAKYALDCEIYDKELLCAALLHDVVEDTNVTLEDIEKSHGKTVAELVDGVTKIRRMNFTTKQDQNSANVRKLVTSMKRDMRIVLIKLFDRLHNMRTLQYKKPEKQIENARETMELYIPMSLLIGTYQVKSELEDLSLMYLEPGIYQDILGKREELGKIERAYLQEIKKNIAAILREENIPSEILIRTRNVCTIWRKIKKGCSIDSISDVFYLKILVDEVKDCFAALNCVHGTVPPINGRLKDYIYTPRTNHYRSLHTTGCDKNGKIIKTKIRTHNMDKVSAYGLPAYWNIDPNLKPKEFPRKMTFEETQEELRKQLKTLDEMDSSIIDNNAFFEVLKREMLAEEHVYINTPDKGTIELPAGSTALDLACTAYPELLDVMTGVIINEKRCPVSTVLENNDTVQIDTKGTINIEDWEKAVHTFSGKNKIKMLIDRQNAQ